MRRNQIVRQRSRLKNIIQSITGLPHGSSPWAEGPQGRLRTPTSFHPAHICVAQGAVPGFSEQILPGDERLAIERHLCEFDRLTDDLKVIERDLAQSALAMKG